MTMMNYFWGNFRLEITGKVWFSIPNRMKDKSQLMLHRNNFWICWSDFCLRVRKRRKCREMCIFVWRIFIFYAKCDARVYLMMVLCYFISGCYSHNKTMNAADWEGRAIHYERPVQKLTSFSLKHYQIIFRQYFFGWPHCDGVRMCMPSIYISYVCTHMYLAFAFILSRSLAGSGSGSHSRAPFVSAFHSDTFGNLLLMCLRVLICDMMAMGKYMYMQPKNGLCISFTLPVIRCVAPLHTHTQSPLCSLFLSLSCASVQCRLHISLYIPRVCVSVLCVLSTHTLSYAICVIGYEHFGDQIHTHTNTNSQIKSCCWFFHMLLLLPISVYLNAPILPKKKNEKENITHKSIRRLFFLGQWYIFISNIASHPNINEFVFVFACVRAYVYHIHYTTLFVRVHFFPFDLVLYYTFFSAAAAVAAKQHSNSHTITY